MIIKNKYITYCSNIFTQKDLNSLLFNLNKYSSILKKNFRNKKFCLGLCFSNILTNTLFKEKNLLKLKRCLIENNFYLSSVNSFVYKSFHSKNIKEKIYYPDWTSYNRVIYTKKILIILDLISNKYCNISISTIPISFKLWFKRQNIKYIYYKSSFNLFNIMFFLLKIFSKKKYFHLDLEPEPFCLLESFNDFLFFFNRWLIPLSKLFGFKKKYLKKYINLCYDISHFSVIYENHESIINLIKKNGIKIGKIQVSSALEFIMTESNKKFILKNLFFLMNSKFLHQSFVVVNQGKIFKFLDFKYACNFVGNFRIHFHMPIYLNNYNYDLNTTSKETLNVLSMILKNIKVKHIEIETYTYSILNQNELFESILKEYFLVLKCIKEV